MKVYVINKKDGSRKTFKSIRFIDLHDDKHLTLYPIIGDVIIMNIDMNKEWISIDPEEILK